MGIKNLKVYKSIRDFFKNLYHVTIAYSDCEIKEAHLHKYVKNGFVRYFPKEKLYYRGYEWTDEIRPIDYENGELTKFELKHGLIRMSDNYEYLRKQHAINKDFIEYEYEYEEEFTTYIIVGSGKNEIMIPQYHTRTCYDWTKNPNHSNLTGEYRIGHYMYEAYKIEGKDDKNFNYNKRGILVKSPKVDDIMTLKDEYEYIKENYTSIHYTYYEKEEEKDNSK